MSNTAAIAELLAQQRTNYRSRLPDQLAQLQALADRLARGEVTKAAVDELHQLLHKLAGAGGTFGLKTLSAHARSLEQQTKGWLSSPLAGVDAPEWREFAANVAGLSETLAEQSETSTAVLPASEDNATDQAVVIWIVEDDPLIGRELSHQLGSFNYDVRLFERINDAEAAAHNDGPDILIMDVMFEQEGQNATKVLPQRPRLKNLGCPLLFISSCDDFQSRAWASRLGAEGYLLKPLNIPRLVSILAEVCEKSTAPPQRVLIVDDDRELAQHYRLVLLNAGMSAEILSRPEEIIDKVESFKPELILMDLYMPDYSGPELAGVIRQHEKWSGLPIVYLSAETDLELQMQAVGRGADDFLTKPITGAHLVSAVGVRIERARQLSAQISLDGLTGLLKHAAIKDAVDREVVRSRRIDTTVTLAMLDIDHFKAVNDSYGHATGDLVISSVAMLLRQRLRSSDIVGRYGGEEFAVALPECSISDAYLLIEDIRQRFSEVCFKHQDQEFSCTLSAGLASSADFPGSNGSELLVTADEALYRAKRGGRDQVQLAAVASPEEIDA